MLCHKCAGYNCEYCNYKGVILKEGPASKLITTAGADLFEAYKDLKTYNTWPVAGGTLNQTSKFLHCVKWVDLINLKMGNIIEDENKARAEIIKKFNKNLRA